MKTRMDLTSKVVLVTGAARGIGAATAEELAARGAHVVAVGLEPDRLARLVDKLGPGHAWVEADVTDQWAIDGAVQETIRRFGRLDACVANAGVVNYGTIQTADPEAFARTVEVNLTGVYRTLVAAVPHLIPTRGHILIVASVASLVPLPGGAAYAAAKAGADALANTLRLELAHTGVTVGCAYPGWIDTRMVRDAEAALPSFRRLREELPWPANSTSTPQACAEALAAGIAGRKRRIYFPRTMAVIAALRPVLTSAVGERIAARRAKSTIQDLDVEVALMDAIDPTTTEAVETATGEPTHG